MATYTYKAKKGVDEIIEGTVEAASRKEAAVKIDSIGLFPLSIEEGTPAISLPKRIGLRDLVEFTHQLSMLINSGSTLLNSLITISVETENASFSPVVMDIIAQIKEGSEFSRALAKYPHVFSQLYVSLVKAGEASGTLGQNLKRLGEFLEEELEFRANIVSILTYPSLIAGVGIVTVFVLLKFVIPKLVNIFAEIDQALPVPTMILVGASDFFSRYWLFMLAACVIFAFSLRNLLRRERYRFLVDKFKLRLPLLGDLIKRIEISHLSRTLSMLLTNGLTLNYSLEVLSFTVSNIFLRHKIRSVKDRVTEGASFGESMRRADIFPKPFINAVSVGEQSARLEEVLGVLSDEYKKDINRRMKRVLTILEPLLILGVGLAVGFVVLSMLLPIFDMDFNF